MTQQTVSLPGSSQAQLRQGLEPYELAEHFNVTEEFIHKALEFYFECGIA